MNNYLFDKQTCSAANNRREPKNEVQKLQDILDKLKYRATVVGIEGRMVTLSSPDLKEYLLARQELKCVRGYEVERLECP